MNFDEVETEEYLHEMLKDYEKLLQLLISLNEHLIGNSAFEDLKVFAFEHQQQLDSLKEKLGKAPGNIFSEANPDSVLPFRQIIIKKNDLIENIKLEEEKAKKMIQAGLESIKIEFARIQELKRVYPNYQKPIENEARFIDNIK